MKCIGALRTAVELEVKDEQWRREVSRYALRQCNENVRAKEYAGGDVIPSMALMAMIGLEP